MFTCSFCGYKTDVGGLESCPGCELIDEFMASKTKVDDLHGEDDGCIGVELTRGVARAYTRGCAVVRVEGAGHFLHQERPDEVTRHLVPFVRACMAQGTMP